MIRKNRLFYLFCLLQIFSFLKAEIIRPRSREYKTGRNLRIEWTPDPIFHKYMHLAIELNCENNTLSTDNKHSHLQQSLTLVILQNLPVNKTKAVWRIPYDFVQSPLHNCTVTTLGFSEKMAMERIDESSPFSIVKSTVPLSMNVPFLYDHSKFLHVSWYPPEKPLYSRYYVLLVQHQGLKPIDVLSSTVAPDKYTFFNWKLESNLMVDGEDYFICLIEKLRYLPEAKPDRSMRGITCSPTFEFQYPSVQHMNEREMFEQINRLMHERTYESNTEDEWWDDEHHHENEAENEQKHRIKTMKRSKTSKHSRSKVIVPQLTESKMTAKHIHPVMLASRKRGKNGLKNMRKNHLAKLKAESAREAKRNDRKRRHRRRRSSSSSSCCSSSSWCSSSSSRSCCSKSRSCSSSSCNSCSRCSSSLSSHEKEEVRRGEFGGDGRLGAPGGGVAADVPEHNQNAPGNQQTSIPQPQSFPINRNTGSTENNGNPTNTNGAGSGAVRPIPGDSVKRHQNEPDSSVPPSNNSATSKGLSLIVSSALLCPLLLFLID